MGIVPTPNTEPLARNEQAMRYRRLGKTGLLVSALSMGCMRLTEDQAHNDKLISTALEMGINYFETTRGYCGWRCQHYAAPGIKGKVKGIIISGKAEVRPETTSYSFLKEIERQLDILGLTHFKFFQVGWFKWPRMPYLLRQGGALEVIHKAKDEGLIQYVGFTTHDTSENSIRIMETGLFDSITLPYNLLYRGYERAIKRAGELGIGVVAMCPVGGGALAYDSHELKKVLNMDMPTAEMALRFVLSNPDVSTACSGMTKVEFIEHNARTVKEFDPERSDIHELICEGVDRLRQKVGEKICTNCGYCMPCPQGVNIPHHMELYRNWQLFGLDATSETWPGDWVRNGLSELVDEQKAANCNQCGECEKKCPNELSVRDTLSKLAF